MDRNGRARIGAITAVVALALVAAGFWLIRNYRAEPQPAASRPPADAAGSPAEDPVPAGAVNETGFPLTLPPGLKISIFAKDLPGARVMRPDQFGNLWVSRTGQGAVTLLEIKDGRVVSQDDIFTGLRKPHGLAFDPGDPLVLYIAEEHRIRSVRTYSDAPAEHFLGLPTSGGGHFTRTLGFGPDEGLYISIGSSCNVCHEEDERRATILRYHPAIRKTEIFARGLRNAVFFAWHPVTGTLWATEMGRDWLGDDLPPDEIVVVEQIFRPVGLHTPRPQARHYGWPYCYGKQVRDTSFEPSAEFDCRQTEPSVIDIPAHSAPLGLAFVPPNSRWPEDYWYDLLVSYHGSWNRSSPTGYKVVRHRFDAHGNYGGVEDFITGWLTPQGALGRPVDILVQSGGVAYISDDHAGVIYRVGIIEPPR